jgi:heat shock protein HtpX
MPKVFVIPTEAPNAFATGRNPEHSSVAATEGILGLLDERELEGVLAHELGHVRNRDILTSSIAATIAAAIMMLARWASWGAMFAGVDSRDDDRRGGNILALILTAILAPLAAMLIQAAISRSREYAADASGAELAGTPNGLASALQKIEATSKRLPLPANPATAHLFIIKPFSGEAMLNLFSTHPPTEKRIARLLGRE